MEAANKRQKKNSQLECANLPTALVSAIVMAARPPPHPCCRELHGHRAMKAWLRRTLRAAAVSADPRGLSPQAQYELWVLQSSADMTVRAYELTLALAIAGSAIPWTLGAVRKLGCFVDEADALFEQLVQGARIVNPADENPDSNSEPSGSDSGSDSD